jgi:hypothetical protein
MTWLHIIRTLHTHQFRLKQMLKDEACIIGFGVTYDSIKDLEVGS